MSVRRDGLPATSCSGILTSPALCTGSWILTRGLVLTAGILLANDFTLWEVALYEEWGAMFASGRDFADTRWQYPPLVVPVLVSASSTGLMPAAFVAMALLADLLNFALLLRGQ